MGDFRIQNLRQNIPIHRLETNKSLEIDFNYMEMGNVGDIALNTHRHEVHRDEYYLFMFADSVDSMYMVDFEEIRVLGRSVIYYVRPGQVHFVDRIRNTRGCALAIDPMLVEQEFRNFFEGQFLTQKPIELDAAAIIRLTEVAKLLHESIKGKQTIFRDKITLSLANVFIGIIAEQYAAGKEVSMQNKSRSALITYGFKALLSTNFRIMKSPSEYAKALNYSLAHLTESVKSVTGFPVSHWIHLQIILEAKRLLYHTNLDVKEIAADLGYEDHTYFSRLFSKIAKISPMAFRAKFRE